MRGWQEGRSVGFSEMEHLLRRLGGQSDKRYLLLAVGATSALVPSLMVPSQLSRPRGPKDNVYSVTNQVNRGRNHSAQRSIVDFRLLSSDTPFGLGKSSAKTARPKMTTRWIMQTNPMR